MNVFTEIEQALEEIHDGWTSTPKAHTLASAIITLRPVVSVEIGVFAGKGLVSMALTHKHINHGIAYGIDPYSSEASVEGQVHESDKAWWKQLNHDSIYAKAIGFIDKFKLNDYCKLIRTKSELFDVPEGIGLLRIDGNHGDMALTDVQRYCPHVIRGGIVVLDDVGWTGNAVTRAAISLEQNPEWRKLYALEDAFVFQKL